MGREVDYLLVNSGDLPESALKRYLEQGEHAFEDDLGDNGKRDVVRANLVANSVIKKDKGDRLVRSLVRHEPKKLGRELYKIFKSNKLGRLFSNIINLYR